jgi:hypothetical protein
VVGALLGLVDWLGELPGAADDAERIDRVAALERVRGAIAAAQARETAEFADSQLAGQSAAGVPDSRRGRGIAEQIGFARRMSPAAAARQISLARVWRLDLPAVLAQLRRGHTSEWAASIVARETTGLPRHTRRRIADDLAPDLPRMSIRQIEAAARRLSYHADPEAIMARGRTAREDRRVTVRPAPDTMALVSAFVPAEQGVAVHASLDRHARGLRAAGDPRTLGQIRADTLVERVTGQAAGTAFPVEISITMTADSLLSPDGDQTPAELDGYGPIPADLALDLVTGTDDNSPEELGAAVWVRRIFTDPVDDTVVNIDTGRRRFDGHLARLIRHRDRVCRDMYCTAPIRHLDHVKPYRDGGPTSATNGAGLCERGNYVKDMPGWTRRVVSEPGTPHSIEIETPTGHRYTSTPPPVLGPGGNYAEQIRRAGQRRFDYLRRERLIASLGRSTQLAGRSAEPP